MPLACSKWKPARIPSRLSTTPEEDRISCNRANTIRVCLCSRDLNHAVFERCYDGRRFPGHHSVALKLSDLEITVYEAGMKVESGQVLDTIPPDRIISKKSSLSTFAVGRMHVKITCP
jgi:hypothetical protein